MLGRPSQNELDAQQFVLKLEEICSEAYDEYEKALDAGVGREQARMLLPQNLYAAWDWKIDLHNLFHFLKLRCDGHTQYEIRVFADAMLKLLTPSVPWSIEAWNDYDPYRGAVKLSRLEWNKLKEIVQWYAVKNALDPLLADDPAHVLNSGNKREDEEPKQNLLKKLGEKLHALWRISNDTARSPEPIHAAHSSW